MNNYYNLVTFNLIEKFKNVLVQKLNLKFLFTSEVGDEFKKIIVANEEDGYYFLSDYRNLHTDSSTSIFNYISASSTNDLNRLKILQLLDIYINLFQELFLLPTIATKNSDDSYSLYTICSNELVKVAGCYCDHKFIRSNIYASAITSSCTINLINHNFIPPLMSENVLLVSMHHVERPNIKLTATNIYKSFIEQEIPVILKNNELAVRYLYHLIIDIKSSLIIKNEIIITSNLTKQKVTVSIDQAVIYIKDQLRLIASIMCQINETNFDKEIDNFFIIKQWCFDCEIPSGYLIPISQKLNLSTVCDFCKNDSKHPILYIK